MHGGSPGDLVVEVFVETPKKLSSKARALLEELRDIEKVEADAAAEKSGKGAKEGSGKWKLFG